MGSCIPFKQKTQPQHQREPLIMSTHSTAHPTDSNNDNQTQIMPLINDNINNEKPEEIKDIILEDIMLEDIILEDKMTLLTVEQSNKLRQDGYCMIDDPLRKEQIAIAVQGYVRSNYDNHGMTKDLIRQIIYYYGSRFNTEIYIELVCNKINPQFFLVPRRNIKLSSLLSKQIEDDTNKIELDDEKVPIETLHHVLTYLGHHKGVEPDPLPCPVRSIYMNQIVSDKWDATFIDAFDKKTIFEIILLSHYFGIQCLLHLGSAKIATLIKQLDQKEINRIIEEEEKYRREHAQDNDGDDNKDENKDNSDDKHDDNKEEEKHDVLETNGNDNKDQDQEEVYADNNEMDIK